MIGIQELLALVLSPRAFLRERLDEPSLPKDMLIGVVTPLAAIRAVAAMLRSLFAGSLLVGVVLGLGSFVLQISTWLGTSLVLPTIARQFGEEVEDRHAAALMTYASVPLWLGGIFYVVPESWGLAFWWSRLAVLLVGLYGLFVCLQGLSELGIRSAVRLPLLAAVAIAYLTLYAVLFTLLGISSHVVISILGG